MHGFAQATLFMVNQMVNRIKLILVQAEYSALLKMADRELRTPDAQAVYILRNEMLRLGYLEPNDLEGGNKHEKDNHLN